MRAQLFRHKTFGAEKSKTFPTLIMSVIIGLWNFAGSSNITLAVGGDRSERAGESKTTERKKPEDRSESVSESSTKKTTEGDVSVDDTGEKDEENERGKKREGGSGVDGREGSGDSAGEKGGGQREQEEEGGKREGSGEGKTATGKRGLKGSSGVSHIGGMRGKKREPYTTKHLHNRRTLSGRGEEKTGFRLNDPDSWVKLRAALEMGFIGLAKHDIQFGKGTTRFDFLDDGGQDNLFFFWRIAARLVLFGNHNIKLLYQPLDLRTSSKLKRDVQIDTVTFTEGTPLQTRYGFDFYRATYLYRFLNRGGFELSAGGGIQIRNARITFTSADGMQRFDSGNIGPVPLLSLEARYNISDRFWLETELDGFYAWLQFVNGGDDPIVGAILDASLRAGFNLNHFIETFVNIRYIGGGGKGTSEGKTVPSDGYTNNWIHAVTLSLGLGIK